MYGSRSKVVNTTKIVFKYRPALTFVDDEAERPFVTLKRKRALPSLSTRVGRGTASEVLSNSSSCENCVGPKHMGAGGEETLLPKLICSHARRLLFPPLRAGWLDGHGKITRTRTRTRTMQSEQKNVNENKNKNEHEKYAGNSE